MSKLIAQVVAGKREDERFTASELAVEINRRFPKSLRQPAAARPVYAKNVRRMKGR